MVTEILVEVRIDRHFTNTKLDLTGEIPAAYVASYIENLSFDTSVIC
jgi:hypothetical protein